jgi:copper transport outer membrane protein MctB
VTALTKHALPLFGCATALAVGVALGAGPLQGGSATGADNLAQKNTALSDRVTALEQGQTFSEAVSAGALPGWVAGRLQGQQVTIVAMPGVSDDRITATHAAVKSAGGTTVATVHLSTELLDPGHKTYVSSVAESSMRGVHDVAATSSSDPYEQISGLLARAYVGRGDALLDDEATKIDSELQGAKLVTVDGQPARRGSATIVLATGEHGTGVTTQATHVIAVSIVDALAAGSNAVVVVTPPTGTESGGLLDALSQTPPGKNTSVSTLDVSDGSAAQVAIVAALASAVKGNAGTYGVVDGSVVLPPGMPAVQQPTAP